MAHSLGMSRFNIFAAAAAAHGLDALASANALSRAFTELEALLLAEEVEATLNTLKEIR